MRIVFIASNRTGQEGGSEELWSKTALYALKHGHEVCCVIFDWEKPHRLHNAIKEAGGFFIFRKLRGVHKSFLQRVFLKFRHYILSSLFGHDYEFRQLKSLSFDIVCLSQGGAYDHAYHPNYETLFRNLRCPYFVLAHSYRDEGFLKAELRERSKRVLTGAKKVFFVALAQKNAIEKQILTKLSNGIIVSNPLNLASREVIPYPESETLLMAMVGHLAVRWKGHDLLLQALSDKKWDERNWFLSIYGIGEDRGNIENLIQFYGLQHKVEFKGFQSDIAKIWSENQVLVMPSRVESAPLTVLEAMFCGRAVLTTDIGDMTSYYEDGHSGFISEAPSSKYLGNALERLWESKNELVNLGVNAHDYVKSFYDTNPEETLLKILIEDE